MARIPAMSLGQMAVSRELVAKAQGAFNVAGGMWPLLSMRSFEAVYGPKVDKWLQRTVAGLLVTTGVTQLLSRTDAELNTARRLGIGTAATLAASDLHLRAEGANQSGLSPRSHLRSRVAGRMARRGVTRATAQCGRIQRLLQGRTRRRWSTCAGYDRG
jgi:hypothetical protein